MDGIEMKTDQEFVPESYIGIRKMTHRCQGNLGEIWTECEDGLFRSKHSGIVLNKKQIAHDVAFGHLLKFVVLEKAPLPIRFAEWLADNEWRRRDHTHPKKVGLYWSDIHCEHKSIEELFGEFELQYQSTNLNQLRK